MPLLNERVDREATSMVLNLGLILLTFVFVSSGEIAYGYDEHSPLQVAPALSSRPLGSPNSILLQADDPNVDDFRYVPKLSDSGSLEVTTIDLTESPEDLWHRIRRGFGMPDLTTKAVADWQAWYLNRPNLLRSVFHRSRRYMYYIVDEIQRRGLPTEIALLPIVESSFNPTAESPARAVGIWQFIPSTGKAYNLEQNLWVDQRRDIVASTSAALDYLQNIYEMHGDWHLALASYNWGEGAVGKAIARNLAKGIPADFANLRMPAETSAYVPKLQALKNIVSTPDLFGIQIAPIPNRPYFSVVFRQQMMDVDIAAKLAEIPIEEFTALNPAYSRPLMPESVNEQLVLPVESVEAFLRNLALHQVSDKPLTRWRTYTSRAGESVESVAKKLGVSVRELRVLNGLRGGKRIPAGTTLLVPVGRSTSFLHSKDMKGGGHSKVRRIGQATSRTGKVVTTRKFSKPKPSKPKR